MSTTARQPRLTKADYDTMKLLKNRARSLKSATHLIGEGICDEDARQALEEAAAVLEDCARSCARKPNVVR